MTHEVGETARTFVDALKEQPLSLALVVMNLALLALLYYAGSSINAQRKSELDLLYSNRREVAILLAGCKWPDNVPLPNFSDHH